MKRRSLFFGLAAAMLVWGSGANQAHAASILLSDLIASGGTFTEDSLTFKIDTYTSATSPANSVFVTFPVPGSTETGFTLTGAFGAPIAGTADANLVYTVTAAPGSFINDATLSGNPAAVGTGVASVTETLHQGASPTGPLIPTTPPLFISSTTPPGPGPIHATFAQQTQITVVKDIEAQGGSGGASLSSVTQTFSVVPEPGSMGLLGIGMAGYLTLRRLMRRKAQV